MWRSVRAVAGVGVVCEEGEWSAGEVVQGMSAAEAGEGPGGEASAGGVGGAGRADHAGGFGSDRGAAGVAVWVWVWASDPVWVSRGPCGGVVAWGAAYSGESAVIVTGV
jgi:hypothetical protein